MAKTQPPATSDSFEREIDTAKIGMLIQSGESVSAFAMNFYKADCALYHLRSNPKLERFYQQWVFSLYLHRSIRIRQLQASERGIKLVFHNCDPKIMQSIAHKDRVELEQECLELRRVIPPISQAQDDKVQNEFFGDIVRRTDDYGFTTSLHAKFRDQQRPAAHRKIEDLYKYVAVLDAKKHDPKKTWRQICLALNVQYKENSVRSQISRLRTLFEKYGISVPNYSSR
jgi:hypothetical protein